MNTLTIRGKLVEDWDMRFSASGNAWATTRVVSARAVRNGDQWEEKDTTFIAVKVFGKHTENIAESVRKGDPVIIIGRIVQENWETDAGDKRSKLVLVADEVAVIVRHHQVRVQRMTRDKAPAANSGTAAGTPAGRRPAPVDDPWATR